MSHSHTHAPGEEHSHSHGPPAPPQGGAPPPPPQMVQPPPDPVMQAVIDASFRPVDLAVAEHVVLCAAHKLERCEECGQDHVSLNRLSKLLVMNPSLLCPPPAKVVNPNMSKAITNTKEEGNALFKAGQYTQAISKYTMSASIAVQRPPWEAQQVMREELSAILSNRSAAEFEQGDLLGALVDADHVITLKRPWSKGHFRKAKALVGMGRLKEAREAIELGLAFEPTSTEMNAFRDEIDAQIRAKGGAKATTA